MSTGPSGEAHQNPAVPRATISAAEAAEQLGVCVGTVYNLANGGRLEGYRVGRKYLIYADSIQSYRKSHALPKAEPAPAHFTRRARRPASMPTGSRYFRL